MSHEFRTPLNAIIGFSDLVRSEAYGPIGNDLYKEYLQDIMMSGNHLLALINDILDLSKAEAGKISLSEAPAAVADIARESAAMLRQQGPMAASHSSATLRPTCRRSSATSGW
jgi:signal transduction histidine kinase